ncbi:hypothetical protein Q1695_000051 [Nippostrongylus brasiliensis]|nr:hypothetical protein Q1695_000051 [Nippostrongylus brasiliensis]
MSSSVSDQATNSPRSFGDHSTVSTGFRYGQMREDRARKRKNSDCDPASMSLSVVAPPPFALSQQHVLVGPESSNAQADEPRALKRKQDELVQEPTGMSSAAAKPSALAATP